MEKLFQYAWTNVAVKLHPVPEDGRYIQAIEILSAFMLWKGQTELTSGCWSEANPCIPFQLAIAFILVRTVLALSNINPNSTGWKEEQLLALEKFWGKEASGLVNSAAPRRIKDPGNHPDLSPLPSLVSLPHFQARSPPVCAACSSSRCDRRTSLNPLDSQGPSHFLLFSTVFTDDCQWERDHTTG